MNKLMDSPRSAHRSLAVVVGCGAMGIAIARRLGQRQRLLLVDKDEDRLEECRAQLDAEGYGVAVCRCDVTDAGSVAPLASRCGAEGGWTTLVHSAALSPSMADCRTILSVNLVGAARVADELLAVARPSAAAIFVSSIAGHMFRTNERIVLMLDDPLRSGWLDEMLASLAEDSTPAMGYGLSKLGVMRLCRRLSSTWGKRGARILSVSPGLIDTPMGRLESQNQPMKRALLTATPLKREGTALEVADAIEYLASDRAAFITGTDLIIDGGVVGALEFASR